MQRQDLDFETRIYPFADEDATPQELAGHAHVTVLHAPILKGTSDYGKVQFNVDFSSHYGVSAKDWEKADAAMRRAFEIAEHLKAAEQEAQR